MIRATVGLALFLTVAGSIVAAQDEVQPEEAPLTDEYGNPLILTQPEEPVVPDDTAVTAPGGVLRVLDRVSGSVTDVELRDGESRALGSLTIALTECRYPSLNPAGDAYALLSVYYRDATAPVFSGWMIASNPALNAMDHPRYDVWVLRCSTS